MKRIIKKFWLLALVGCSFFDVHAQTIKPDLQDTSKWRLYNRSVEIINEEGKKAVRLSEAANDGFMILKGFEFSSGTIEFDVKGKNVLQQSFVGIAFHGVDEKTFDAVYFRPFNFINADTARRSRAVQYVSMPEYPWEKLRSESPSKYENKVHPVPNPDGWFHVKLIVDGKRVSAFVNNSPSPSLQVEKLTNVSKGGLALWVGNGSGGSFANLTITPSNVSVQAKQIPYGNNPEVGKYLNVGDAKLYYEIYGRGKPFVLLHGGVYGYIDEYEPFIERLSQSYQVICIATRGHGKSEAGKEDFSFNQRAEDAYKIIRSITKDSVIVLGFSDGGYSAFRLAALHPEMVKKLIVIGAGDYETNTKKQKFNYIPEGLMQYDSAFFKSRLALMPEPQRWREILTKLSKMYNEDTTSTEVFRKIKCPTLVIGGDRDDYISPESMVSCAKSIPNSQLSIIPGCSHVVFFCNFPAVREAIGPFLSNKDQVE
jgi:pimeloyl-ACP methyl ester carboxylesterase